MTQPRTLKFQSGIVESGTTREFKISSRDPVSTNTTTTKDEYVTVKYDAPDDENSITQSIRIQFLPKA